MLLYGCVFSAYIFWRELNPYYLADSRVLWKIQAIKVHCKQNMFLFEFWNGRGMNNMFNFQQVDFWIIKAKTIEISIYLQVVLSLFVCLFLCLFVFKSIQLHYFSHLLDGDFLVLCHLETGQQCIAYSSLHFLLLLSALNRQKNHRPIWYDLQVKGNEW